MEALRLLKGCVEEFLGLQTYITGPRDSKRAIILLSDAAGFENPIFRKLADKAAEAEFLVLAPDFFHGDPLDSTNPQADKDAWMKAHDPAKGFEDCKVIVEALKTLGATAIGAAGFGWGGMVAVKLAKYPDLVKAVVILHPELITDDEIEEVKVPTALLGAEEDHVFSVEKLEDLAITLATLPDVESLLKTYPGTKHGWTLMYKPDDGPAVCRAKEAHSDMLVWLKRRV